nr:MAG TPA: Regulator of ribonuclease activity B [Caudoviricetes sp.]
MDPQRIPKPRAFCDALQPTFAERLMTANSPMLEIKQEISLAQLWLPKPDMCDINESRMTAHLEWCNPYNGAVIDVVVENTDDGAISKWIIYGWPLNVVGNSNKTSDQDTSNFARRLAAIWARIEYDVIAIRRLREIDNTIHKILNSPSVIVRDDARSDLMGVLDDIAHEHGGDYQRWGL